MLKHMRTGAQSTVLKIVLSGFLFLALGGLVLMDVQGVFRSVSSSGAILTVGRDKITAPQFDQMVQSAIREQQMRQADAYRAGVPLQVLRRELDGRLFSKAAADIGLYIDDATAAQQIREIITPLVEQGNDERAALQRLLRAYGYTEKQLVSLIKEQLATQALLNTLTSGARTPQLLVNDALRYQNEWRRGDYFTIAAADLEKTTAPSEQELRAYYDTVAADYAVPEYRDLSIVVINRNTLGEAMKVPAEKVRAYYEENISEYSTPETRVIAQAVVADRITADKIFAAVQNGTDLQSAAKEEVKASFIAAAPYNEQSLPPQLAQAAFAAKENDTLAPIETPLGWHIMSITKVQPAAPRSFDSVKAEIERDIAQDNASEALYQIANAIDDGIAGGKTLTELAKENNLPVTVLKKVDARGIGQNGKKTDVQIPVAERVMAQAFTLRKGASSQLIETPEGAFVIVAAEEIYPSEQQSFETVRKDLMARWQSSEHARQLSQTAGKLMERLRAGEDFNKLAGEFKKTVKSTGLVRRGDLESKLDLGMLTSLFSLDGVGRATAISNDGAVTVLRLSERDIKAVTPDEKQLKSLETILSRSLQQDILEQYRHSLMAKYNVKVNDRLLADMYTPKEDSFE